MWWTNVVRVRGSVAVGTGVFVGPRHVLTALHVIQTDAGEIDEASAIVVSQQHGPQITLHAVSVRVPEDWQSNPGLKDLAVIQVPLLVGAGLPIAMDYGAEHSEHAVGAYGYPGQPPAGGSPGVYSSGHIRRAGDTLRSKDLRVDPGVSGGPILTEVASVVKVVGIVTARSVTAGEDIAVGLPLLSSTFGKIFDT